MHGQAGEGAAAGVETGAGDTAQAVGAAVEAQVAQKGKDDGFFVVDDAVGRDGDFAAGNLGL